MSKIKNLQKEMLRYENITYLKKNMILLYGYIMLILLKIKLKKLKKFDNIRFAQKSCSNINILKIIKSYGVKVDAVSLGEIIRALTAGFTSKNNDLVFTSDILEDKTLKKIIQYHIPVNIGSLNMIEKIGKISPKHPVWLRINPKFGDGHHIKTNTGGENSKHGIWDINKAISDLKYYNLSLIGLHMHIGSGINLDNIKKMCDSMIQCALNINQKIQFISAGGGLNIPYKPHEKEINLEFYYNMWNKTRNFISSQLSCPIKLEVEPGRFIVAQSGVLITQVCAVKQMGNNCFIIINSGFNDLIRPMLYGSYHKISVIHQLNKMPIVQSTTDYIIAGPLCESGDLFTTNHEGLLLKRTLPTVIPGDYIIIHDTGAYGASMSSNYNSRPLIPEILYQNNNFYTIRKRQKIKDLIQLEL
ncbi:diaminopimelate decarboxylase [Buchnera aphidicola (Cinara tujafilina)]|uniref:Diaminopimelate decarboxylase n=1 Tax=Buchnera aphidicola (Cinara tujafilina) TaxID=261317 RepID=F7WZJ3_9GAMM|nr:diaminopimelate decarboxylase [Buchnera aphidicola]AEH39860.1 diaminopimelate decarboxylase [Buchnera aphidicola (Cinara tujafilina)]